MPGSPATSPRFGAPRYANSDAVDFAGQVNGITDVFDLNAARFLSGTFASRPATPADRTYYYATDHSGQATQLSAYVGGSWQNIPLGQVGTSEIQDAAVTDAKVTVEAEQTLAFSIPMSPGTAVPMTLRYYKDTARRCWMSIAENPTVQNGVFSTAAWFTLPVGYRPAADLHIPGFSFRNTNGLTSSPQMMWVRTTGVVQPAQTLEITSGAPYTWNGQFSFRLP